MSERLLTPDHPNLDSPLDVRVWLGSEVLGACGCSDLEAMLDLAVAVLTDLPGSYTPEREKLPRTRWDDLVAKHFRGHEAAAYIIVGVLDNADLIEHGTAIRGSWTTPKGDQLLATVAKAGGVRGLLAATGVAYNGCEYESELDQDEHPLQ